MKKDFTPGEVAKICGISYGTVVNYCEQQKIKNLKSPITHHRRVSREALEAFMQKHGLPMAVLRKYDSRDVMIVEDCEADRKWLERMLNSNFKDALNLSFYSDGYSALLRLGEWQPDLLILDILLPNVDGFQICKSLRSNEQTSNIRVIATSGSDNPGLPQRIIECGADVYVPKPFDEESLIFTVGEFLHLKPNLKGS